VGVTRARQRLTISGCAERKRFGEVNKTTKSRFLEELPEEGVISFDRTDGSAGEEDHGKAREAALEKLAGLFDFSGSSDE